MQSIGAIMSNWTNNNIAHRNTWATLLGLGELSVGFAEAKPLKMKDLNFWSGIASGEMNDLRAEALGAQLHNLCIMYWAADYEDSVDQAKALAKIGKILKNPKAGVPKLARALDDSYRFVGEPEADFPAEEIANVPGDAEGDQT